MADHAPHDLTIQLQDGGELVLFRDEDDRLMVSAWRPAAKGRHSALEGLVGHECVGFGPWPSWGTNVTNRVVTLPDDDSGLFEPERLFVLREQYAFVSHGEGHPASLGPIHKAFWAGTEGVVQARIKAERH